MVNFKQFLLLNEFRSNKPLGQEFDRNTLISWIDDCEIMKFHIVIPNNKDILIGKYTELGPNDIFYILFDRKNKEDLVGYMYVHDMKDKNIWQVRDVKIFENYQGKGIGLDLYVKLINEGLNLINGYSLSTEAEKLWRKLIQFVNVKTYNLKTKEITNFSELPKQNDVDDGKQEYFWIASSKNSSKLSESLWHKDGPMEDWFEKFLKGQLSPSFGTNKFGQEGDL